MNKVMSFGLGARGNGKLRHDAVRPGQQYVCDAGMRADGFAIGQS
jgi:hypothetical protein